MTIKYFHECLTIHREFIGIFSDLDPSQFNTSETHSVFDHTPGQKAILHVAFEHN